MNRRLNYLAAALAAILAGPVCLAQTDTPEVEPNETKLTATVVPAMAPNDTISGVCTGTGTAPGVASLDTWDITTTPADAPGIYEYRLVINDPGTTGHTISLRGFTQTNGVIASGSDIAVQNVTPATAHFVKWYANEQPSHVFFRIFGTSTTTAPYSVVLQRFPVTVTQVTNPVDAGPVYITTIGQTTVNTDLWLYDSNLNAIVDAGNDNETVAGGGTGATQLSRLQRTLAPGNYIVAIGPSNLANNLASPTDDGNRNSPVMDFPNAICTSLALGTADLDFVIGNRCSGNTQGISMTGAFLEVQFASFTVAAPQLPDPVVLTAGSATPANAGQGTSTLLTVTATGGSPAPITADLTAFGLTGAEAFHDDGVNGDAAAGDGIWSYTLSVPVTQSTGSYSINVTGTSGGCIPPTRTITLGVTPPNNSCFNAVPISVGGAYPGTTLGAVGAGGSTSNCNTIGGTGPGVWYTFTETSPTPRRLIATVCDPVTNFDAQMVLYTGSCGSFTCVWGNDTAGFGCPYQDAARNNGGTVHSDVPSIINWTPGAPGYKCTSPGTVYYLCVLNRAVANGGNFVLHLDDSGETCEGLPPANDVCATARPLTTFPTWDLVFRDFATPDADVSCNDPASTSSRGGIWYTFTPATPGNLFHAKIPDQGATGSSFDTVVTVFSANPDCSNLTEVACVDAVEGYVNRFTTPIAALTGHTTYYIEVSSYSPTASIPGGENLGFNFVSTGLSPCCRSDYNGDGDVGTDADINAFFACLGGNCCPTCPPNADFNCDGDIGTDGDIESFFRVLGGGPC